MPTVTSRTAEEKDAALFIFSSHGVAQWGEASLFLFSVCLYYPGFSLAWDGGTTFSWEFHSKCSISLSLCLPNVLSLWKRVSIMLGYPEEEEGKQGVCNPK